MIELLVGMGLGFIISMTGVGGGVLMIPVLRFMFGLDPVAAVATANLCSMLMKVSSSVTHYHLGNIPLKLSALFLLVTAPMTILGSYLVTYGSTTAYSASINLAVDILVLLAMVGSLAVMISNRIRPARPLPSNAPNYSLSPSQVDAQSFAFAEWRKIILPGLFAGSVIGTTGVGGGVIVLPILTRYLGLNIKQAIGVSVGVTMLLSGFAALTYGLGGQTDVVLSLQLFAGSIIAIPIAHRIMRIIPATKLDTITLILVFISVGSMCWEYLPTIK
ncbi:sulfite exporter TauE/SafE family protein [Vibrio sp. SM6]|uniref:Probable membrane transporter protein n=1 Tax=Vibrio agarilyticus TaxID=2726741 RepID=A0A7X8TQ31_9VIBR|nr:sulfite exporter TauE/SafE family protein [Vibrio agarilyticus]NLS12148.1 sulfite exporter TauE/SafE family protein [Vibrio agarilyticus]